MALIQYLTHINIEFGARKPLAAECERVGLGVGGIPCK